MSESTTVTSPDQLNLALAELINRAVTSVDAAVDFMSAELPDVVSQLILFYTVKYGLLALITMTFLTFAIHSGYKWAKWMGRHGDPDLHTDRENWLIGHACIGLLTGLLGVLTANSVGLFLKIVLAPKVWLIEYGAKLVS